MLRGTLTLYPACMLRQREQPGYGLVLITSQTSGSVDPGGICFSADW